MHPALNVDQALLESYCRKHRIKTLSLFGSMLRGDFREDSDIDILVEFEEGVRIGLFGIAGMELELTDLLGRKVDLRTPAELSPLFRPDVLEEAEIQYAQGR